jgi:hypothetical protein
MSIRVNKRKYHYWDRTRTRKVAKAKAKALRKHGWLARIRKTDDGSYQVYRTKR